MNMPVFQVPSTREEYLEEESKKYCPCGNKVEIAGLCLACMQSKVVMDTMMMERII